jgi:hypothetical protein
MNLGKVSLPLQTPRNPLRLGQFFSFALALAGTHAKGAVTAFAPAPSSSAATAPVRSATCIEQIPDGKARPYSTEQFPEKVKAGYAEYLEFTTEHGRAETVLVNSTHFTQSDDAKAFEQSGFVIPDPRGGSVANLTTEVKGDRVTSKLKIPFVALPSDTKQRTLTLPPIPVAIRRANGETMTLCTQPHLVRVESPAVNTPDAHPHANPAFRRQLEEWTSLKQAAKIGGIGLVAGALLAGLVWLWLKRPRRVPPPPPPRPPWELAFEELSALKSLELLHAQRYSDFYAQVSDTVRKYLGGRYGYDGLECTTREAILELHRQAISQATFFSIDQFLTQADLVKFARLTPSEPECLVALKEAETIVTATLPVPEAPQSKDDETERGAPTKS